MFTYTADVESIGKYDVAICGGGSAGFCAAVAAAKTGKKVVLIERYGMLGGIMTVGGNPEIGLFYAFGKQIIKGIGWEFLTRLKEAGGARFPDFENENRHYLLNVSVNPFMASLYMDKICLENNITLLYNHQVAGVIKEEGIIKGVVTLSKNGLQAVLADVFVDCTGDGDLCAFAGAEYELGAEDGELQPGTLPFCITGFDLNLMDAEQVEKSYKTAIENGELIHNDYWPMRNAIGLFEGNTNNANHVDYNAQNKSAISFAEIEAKKSIERIINWARNSLPGAEKIEVAACSPSVSMREWRRIKCLTQVTCEDYVSGRNYDDAVCYSYYPIDLHRTSEAPLFNIFMEENIVPTIPYSAMVVKGFSNLLVAGRCIDSDRLANSALRVKSSCMAMGQAAGVAAAIASVKQLACKDVNVDEIKGVLIKQDAICPL